MVAVGGDEEVAAKEINGDSIELGNGGGAARARESGASSGEGEKERGRLRKPYIGRDGEGKGRQGKRRSEARRPGINGAQWRLSLPAEEGGRRGGYSGTSLRIEGAPKWRGRGGRRAAAASRAADGVRR